MEPRRVLATDRDVRDPGIRPSAPAGVLAATSDGSALVFDSKASGVPDGGAPAARDEELIARAQEDPKAFAVIYRLHYGAIGSYLYRRVGDRHATEDLVAETFLVALREIPRFEWRGIPVLHWLYRIATHAANRWARRRRFLDLARVREPAASDAADHAWVHHALRRLPVRFQEVLALHYFAELPVENVARILGVAAGTVKSRLARARDALRGRLARGQEP